MTTEAQKAYGTTVTFDGVTLGELMSVNGSEPQNMIEVFSCDSPDETSEYLDGGASGGQITLGFVYQHGSAKNYDACIDKKGRKINGSLVLSGPTPNGATAPSITCTARISNLTLPQFGSARDFKTFEVTFHCSGKWTYKNSANSTASGSPSASASSSTST